MGGEKLHQIGRAGAIAAKRWLEATTRVDVPWVNPEYESKLTFEWKLPGSSFSFDLGGTLRGGTFHGQEFLAEVKKYSDIGHQPAEYKSYLAKCYRSLVDRPDRCDHFMWLTWHPFDVTTWSSLCTAGNVRAAVLLHREKSLGESDATLAEALVDDAVCADVAERLWLIVLSEKQETLVIDSEDLDLVVARQRRRHS